MASKIDTHKHDQADKRTYRKPKLSRLGSISEITKSGTGVSPENNQGQGQKTKRP